MKVKQVTQSILIYQAKGIELMISLDKACSVYNREVSADDIFPASIFLETIIMPIKKVWPN